MIDNQIRNKIKKIKLITKRMMHSTLSGDYLSAFKGTGLEFHQIRNYQLGDDVRSIDWKSSAKMNNIMVKEFIEDRERTIVIAMDTSASLAYGSDSMLKQETVQDVAAALACIAHENKDNIGLLLFADTVHTTLPAKKGHAHVSTILEHIYNTPVTGSTNFTALGDYLLKHPQKNMVLVIVSDWLFDDEQPLNNFKTITKLYDVIAVRISDPCEQQLPDVGYLEIRDPETGATALVNARSINHFLQEQQASMKHFFDRNRMSTLQIAAGSAFIPPLARFLQFRSRR
jgi:uncharacterized protein (DUF58 family)